MLCGRLRRHLYWEVIHVETPQRLLRVASADRWPRGRVRAGDVRPGRIQAVDARRTSRAGTAGEMQKGDAMKAGRWARLGNTGVPGASPAAEGNKNQDSRTTKTRDR